MRNLLLIWLIFLFACNSEVDKKTIAQKDSLNDAPIKIVFDARPFGSRPYYAASDDDDTILKKGVPEQLKQFRGSWIRTDFLDTVLKTKSTSQTRRKVVDDDDLSLNMTNNNYGDTLQLNFSISGYNSSDPSILFVKYKVQREQNGFPIYDTNPNNLGKSWLLMAESQLQITHFGNGKYTKKLYTKISNNLTFENSIRKVVAKIIIGKYNLLDKNNKIIKENIYFSDKLQTNFPEFKDYYFWSPHSVELTPAVGTRNFYEEQDTTIKKNEKQDTAKARQKWIERYVKRGALTDEDILFLGNQKYGSYFAVRYVKDTFLLYPLNKTDQVFGRIGNVIYKKKLYYKLVVRNK